MHKATVFIISIKFACKIFTSHEELTGSRVEFGQTDPTGGKLSRKQGAAVRKPRFNFQHVVHRHAERVNSSSET